MSELKRLDAGHAPMVLAFERANRDYFAASVSDRGDDFFEHFTDRYLALLAEQEAGTCACYVLAAEDGSVLGRFNLYDIQNGAAVLGYRVAQQVAGRGVATATVRELCRLAAGNEIAAVAFTSLWFPAYLVTVVAPIECPTSASRDGSTSGRLRSWARATSRLCCRAWSEASLPPVASGSGVVLVPCRAKSSRTTM
jgi:Acetyltransferase (GNAT) family